MTWNPWKALRIERQRIVELECAVEDAWRTAEMVERAALQRFEYQTAVLQAERDRLLKQLVDINNLTLPKLVIAAELKQCPNCYRPNPMSEITCYGCGKLFVPRETI